MQLKLEGKIALITGGLRGIGAATVDGGTNAWPTALRYAIHFNDGVSTECSSSDAALRVIAYRHRVAPGDLVTDKTEERILVWIYPGEDTIAEVIISAWGKWSIWTNYEIFADCADWIHSGGSLTLKYLGEASPHPAVIGAVPSELIV